MQKDDSVYVGHMLDMARKALEKIRGMNRSEYDADEDLRMALTHLIQTVGEAARGVSPAFQRRHDSVPWRQIIGMRHKVVHDYAPCRLRPRVGCRDSGLATARGGT